MQTPNYQNSLRVIAILLLITVRAHAGELQNVRLPIVLDGQKVIITAERATTSLGENLLFIEGPRICDVQMKSCRVEPYMSLDFRTGIVQTERRVYSIDKQLK